MLRLLSLVLWFYGMQDGMNYTGMHGQQNIKYYINLFVSSLMMEAEGWSETSVHFYYTTRRPHPKNPAQQAADHHV